MVNKTKKTFKEWIALAQEKLEALLKQPEKEQNKKVNYFIVKSLTTHLMNPEMKNRPDGIIYERLSAHLYDRVNNGKGFTQLEVLKIKSSDKFPKPLATSFKKSYENWQAENLG